MSKGFIITKWTEDRGLVIHLKYPETINVDLDDMMRIFYAHITGAGEAGYVVVRLEKAQSNVASYFTGIDSSNPYMINLMLELGEDPETYGEKVIRDIYYDILKYLLEMDKDMYKAPELIKELKVYLRETMILLERLKNLTKEQKMAQIYTGEKTRKILQLLQQKAMSRKELQNRLEDQLKKIITNLDITLEPFIKADLIKQDWVERSTDVHIFLQNDFTIFRGTPKKLMNEAKKDQPTNYLAKQYLKKVREFYNGYTPTFEDNIKIASHMINPDTYDYIALLRDKPYPLNKLPKSSGSVAKQTADLLYNLEQDNIISIIEDEKDIKWVFLLSDIIVQNFYPEYLVENIRKDFVGGDLRREIATKHLEILETAYPKS
ncbi:MAG: hypothetical protein JXA99_00280 [Candidatus Lokiarchaeota archaeon]|nr:hypothetical protein [Candidatus Lokiarchaeota archaeon]